MPPPLAFLSYEELHWQSDLGLPNQRRWLNHRNVGDEHRRMFPSAGTDINTDAQPQETGVFFDALHHDTGGQWFECEPVLLVEKTQLKNASEATDFKCKLSGLVN